MVIIEVHHIHDSPIPCTRILFIPDKCGVHTEHERCSSFGKIDM